MKPRTALGVEMGGCHGIAVCNSTWNWDVIQPCGVEGNSFQNLGLLSLCEEWVDNPDPSNSFRNTFWDSHRNCLLQRNTLGWFWWCVVGFVIKLHSPLTIGHLPKEYNKRKRRYSVLFSSPRALEVLAHSDVASMHQYQTVVLWSLGHVIIFIILSRSFSRSLFLYPPPPISLALSLCLYGQLNSIFIN